MSSDRRIMASACQQMRFGNVHQKPRIYKSSVFVSHRSYMYIVHIIHSTETSTRALCTHAYYNVFKRFSSERCKYYKQEKRVLVESCIHCVSVSVCVIPHQERYGWENRLKCVRIFLIIPTYIFFHENLKGVPSWRSRCYSCRPIPHHRLYKYIHI